jgi:mortality factor 4-like protein 1
VRIPIPDLLKSILVDDWEFVTKNQTLVKLPSKRPVNVILQDYFDQEKTKRRLGSAEADLLEEVVQGVKDYFKKALGRILLYSFEREQYQEIRKLYENAPEGSEWANKDAGDVYGAEHLCRLFGKQFSVSTNALVFLCSH